MKTQDPSTSASPHCCGYHSKKSAKKCKSQAVSRSLHLPTVLEMRKQPCGSYLGVILYIILALVLLVISLTELVVTIGSYILTKDLLHAELTGRLAGIVLLGLCAAVTVVAVAFGINAIRKKDRFTLQTVSILTVILAIIEILVVIFAVTIKKTDNDTIESTLTDSFILAFDKQDNAHIKKWDFMQATYNCCGLIGPSDYFHAHHEYGLLPFSCCSSVTPSTMEALKEVCHYTKSFHMDGCVDKASIVFRKTVQYLSVVSLVFIVMELLLSGVGFYLVKKRNLVKNNPPPLTNEKLPEDSPE